MKKNILAFLLLLVMMPCLSQTGKSDDVVYLKSQWIIRGKILQQDDTVVKIQSLEGNIYVFSRKEIDKIAREKAWGSFTYRKSGFASFTELGPLIAGKTTIDGVTTAAFSFQTVNGYKFSQYAMLGLGVGADLYATQTIIPVFGSFRGDLFSSGSIIPFYFADLGYGINITQQSDNGTSFKGGLMYAGGLGLKIPFNRNAGFLLSAGYRFQRTSYTADASNKTVDYSRLAIRAGFFL